MSKYDWLDITSEVNMKDKYKLKEIADTVDKDLDLQGIIKFKSYKNIFIFIKALKNFINIYMRNKDGFFISDEHKYAFMLLNYNTNFDEELGITRKHYVNRELAKEWKLKYIKMFHPDQGFVLKGQEAVVESINQLYRRMVGEA